MSREDLLIPLAICLAVNVVIWAIVAHLHLIQ
jgi:hypothetical protein